MFLKRDLGAKEKEACKACEGSLGDCFYAGDLRSPPASSLIMTNLMILTNLMIMTNLMIITNLMTVMTMIIIVIIMMIMSVK